MSLSSREEILHWNLRHLIVCHTIAMLVCAFCALLTFGVACLPFSGRHAFVFAGVFFSFFGFCFAWRLKRLWRELLALEQFIK